MTDEKRKFNKVIKGRRKHAGKIIQALSRVRQMVNKYKKHHA